MGNTLNWFSGKKRKSLGTERIGSVSCKELYQLLQELAKKADRIAASSLCPLEQYQELAAAVSEIGELLLAVMVAKPATRMSPLFLLFSELKGRVKEMKNDLRGVHTC